MEAIFRAILISNTSFALHHHGMRSGRGPLPGADDAAGRTGACRHTKLQYLVEGTSLNTFMPQFYAWTSHFVKPNGR